MVIAMTGRAGNLSCRARMRSRPFEDLSWMSANTRSGWLVSMVASAGCTSSASPQTQSVASSSKLAEVLAGQYRQHPNWSYQFHCDNLAALAEQQPELGLPSYVSVLR